MKEIENKLCLHAKNKIELIKKTNDKITLCIILNIILVLLILFQLFANN